MSDLLEWLDQEDCKLIYEEDPSHMNWRENLKMGDIINCNGIPLVLGIQVSPDKLIDDVFKVFELRDFPDFVVKIACNRFILFLEEKQSQSDAGHWGVRLVETISYGQTTTDVNFKAGGLDRLGQCVVMEKLTLPLASQIWTSRQMILSKEDEKKALVLANHFFCMAENYATCLNLSFSHLMWDKNEILKSTRLLKKGPPNYNEWETHCIKVAKGNLNILNFLMHVSNLISHDVALYYRGAIEYTLTTGGTDLIGRALPRGHREDYYEERVKQLCKEAIDLRNNCLKTVISHLRRSKQYKHEQVEQIKIAISAKLVELYRFSATPGTFPPDLENQVINSFAKISSQKINLEDPTPFLTYYEEKRNLMMDYNEACNYTI